MKTAQFNTKFLQLKDALYAYLLGFIKHKEDAGDLLQDLYVKLWDKRRIIKEEKARFYFFSTARNLCIDHFRKKKRELEPEFSMVHECPVSMDYEKKELSQLFRLAIERLPSASREAIFLKDVCMMETKEVEEITHYNSNQLRVNLSRARKAVKEELETIYRYEKL